MNVEVTKDEVRILEGSDLPNENEYKITTCYFTFDAFTSSFQVKRAIFTIFSTGEMYETDIINGECDIPIEVLKKEYERIKLGVYGYNIGENEELLNRFSPSYDEFIVPTGSYEEGALTPEPITPSQYDLYSQALQEGLSEVDEALEEVSNVNISAEQLENGTSVTITDRNGEDKTVTIHDGVSVENMEITNNHLFATYSDSEESVDLGQVVPIKGQDYFTTSEINDIENTVKNQVKSDLDFDNTINRVEQEISNINTNKASKTELEQEKSARELSDTNLQSQIDAITSSSDVVDIVATYSELQNYDTSTLTEEDVIKVLNDSTHNNAISYYRWSNSIWNYIGSEGPFYTRSETDSLLNAKQSKITDSNKLSSNLVDDTNSINKFVTSEEKTTWNNKLEESDLTDYVKNTDYATASVGGVVKINSSYGVNVGTSGALTSFTRTYQDYQSSGNTLIIGKGTLENVIIGKDLTTKAYVDGLVGDISSVIDAINGEVI